MTSTRTSQETPQWVARPVLSVLLRVAITVTPLAFVVFGAWRVHLALGPPERQIDALARWVALSAACTISIRLLDRLAKRLLPLAVLLRMTIVFPDDVPSRFRVALRYGSTRQLERDVSNDTLADHTPQQAAERLLGLVAQLSDHDRATRGHTERVRAYADLVAEEMGFSNEERQKLHWAGLIHDIGKLAVPAEILNKVDPLTDQEWARIRMHPNEGWTLVEPLREWLGEWAESTRDHHERWDGAGYPRGLRGHEISRAGRIVAVVDAFDVMTSARSYKQALTFDEARAELADSAGTHFDPEVVRAFLSLSLTKRRLRWAALSWVANSPVVASVSSGTASIPVSLAAGMAAATIAGGGVLVPLAPVDDPPEVAAERIADEPTTTLPNPPSTTIAITTTTERATTTSTTSTTTTVAVTPTTTPGVVTTTATPTTTAAPTTTAPPTTTTVVPTTTSPPPTTTVPAGFTVGYLNGGSAPVLALVDSLQGSTVAIVDGDADPGLTLIPSPDGLIEIDDPEVQAWSTPVTVDTPMVGHAAMLLHAAIANYQDGFGVLLVGVSECATPSAQCTAIASGQGGFAQVGFGADFGALVVDLGPINHTLTAGNYLVITVANAASSTHTVWLQFGSDTYPSRLMLS